MSWPRILSSRRSRTAATVTAGALTAAVVAAATWTASLPGSLAALPSHAQTSPLRNTTAELTAAHWTAASSTKASSGSPQQIAKNMLASFGWSAGQFACLQPLWQHESGWRVTAYNAGTGAYGIPQAVPGSKMASAGPNWQTNATTQITWGLRYIKGRYGSPCGAWSHEQATGWY